ncbi:type II toxin-antitoxin system Phd/YefM family antitoxin [Streptomyces sp. NRRL S-350]|uniref:type II toxin-antitoxin system Phd/YefM family antitoxin n=1 Tax=Streptomyces sp. NRRL S-350 TaxID=1463902 RepID=UPI0004C0D854|nr:type II toxin-antitoxin system Phd/YefM family antitoxin [Streptomyces sp. NRRL S-350]
MSDIVPITEARARLGKLVRPASHARERITITGHGQPAAVLINPQEPADLEDVPALAVALALALARYRARQVADAAAAVPHEQVRAQLGLGSTA